MDWDSMVLKPYFLRGFKTLFFHRKPEGPGLKPYEKIGFSALLRVVALPLAFPSAPGTASNRLILVIDRQRDVQGRRPPYQHLKESLRKPLKDCFYIRLMEPSTGYKESIKSVDGAPGGHFGVFEMLLELHQKC